MEMGQRCVIQDVKPHFENLVEMYVMTAEEILFEGMQGERLIERKLDRKHHVGVTSHPVPKS